MGLSLDTIFCQSEGICGITYCQVTAQLSRAQISAIEAHILNLVNTWCINNGSKKFTIRDFAGGQNYNWNGTPLIDLYNWHRNNNSTDPEYDAGMDAGRILKRILCKNTKAFNTQAGVNSQPRSYWL
ncbi:MAG: hypothetical protein ACRC5H_03780 [Treponemataceae bacterium]